MAATDDILDEGQVDAALAELPDWRYRLGGLVTAFKAPTAAAVCNRVSTSAPASRSERYPATNASPAPTVSTATT